MSRKICIIQTGTASSAELTALCAELMPDVAAYQIIDDSLLKEISAAGDLTPSVCRRMYAYCLQAQEMGADAILHHCVAAAGLAELVQPFLDIPIVRIDEGMAREAVRTGGRIAVFATSALALEHSAGLILRVAEAETRAVGVSVHLLQDARNTLRAAAEAACRDSDVLVLAQPSMTALLPLLEGVGKPVLSCTRSGIEFLKARLGEAGTA